MQQVSVSWTVVLLTASPARFTASEYHQTTSEHCQEVVRLFAMYHANLQVNLLATGAVKQTEDQKHPVRYLLPHVSVLQLFDFQLEARTERTNGQTDRQRETDRQDP